MSKLVSKIFNIIDRTKLIKKLLLKGADLELKNNKGQTALEFAEENNRTNMVKLLMSSKQNVCTDSFITPPLTKKDNSFFNVVFFIAIHIICETIGYFILLPRKYITNK